MAANSSEKFCTANVYFFSLIVREMNAVNFNFFCSCSFCIHFAFIWMHFLTTFQGSLFVDVISIHVLILYLSVCVFYIRACMCLACYCLFSSFNSSFLYCSIHMMLLLHYNCILISVSLYNHTNTLTCQVYVKLLTNVCHPRPEIYATVNYFQFSCNNYTHFWAT